MPSRLLSLRAECSGRMPPFGTGKRALGPPIVDDRRQIIMPPSVMFL
eukprot:SAG31_NODE_42709_length_270_cov_0.842105_1_plen_46_part_10